MSNSKKIVFAILLCGLVVMAAFSYFVYSTIFVPNTFFQNNEAHIYISRSASFNDVVVEISPLLIDVETFTTVANKKGYSSNVKSGHYIIKKGMNNNEIIESIKKAFRISIEKLDNHYMFYLNEMVTPKLITLFYWILLFAFITNGLGDIFLEGDFWRGLVWVVGGALASRVSCELVVILFRINENLNEINEKTSENDSLSHTSFEKDYYKH